MPCSLRTIACTLALLCAAAAPAHAERAVILVRHAEKASQTERDPALSLRGEDRALSLATFLRGNPIHSVFVSEFRRTKDTAAYLARQRKLTPIVLPAGDTAALVALIKKTPPDAVVVVVGHSNTVPEIIKALGVELPVTFNDDQYDRVFVVTPQANGKGALLEFTY